jgi:hypothetical protein
MQPASTGALLVMPSTPGRMGVLVVGTVIICLLGGTKALLMERHRSFWAYLC